MKTFNIAEAKHYLDTSMMQSLHEPITVTDQSCRSGMRFMPDINSRKMVGNEKMLPT